MISTPVVKHPIAILISGRGSNMRALIEACADPAYPARIVAVLSNKAEAPGIVTAQNAGLHTVVIPSRPYGKDREAHEKALDAALREAGARTLCLAGYMRVLTPWLVKAWEGRMLNIHPSLLPAFPGLDTHARAIDSGALTHGCTVHIVTDGVDEGPIIAQAEVPVHQEDTPETLAGRVLEQEHCLYPAALRQFLNS